MLDPKGELTRKTEEYAIQAEGTARAKALGWKGPT